MPFPKSRRRRDLLNLFAARPRPSLPAKRRVYAIGDVHGRLDLLEALYAKVALDDAGREPANTEIILLGDLIDRGPESAGVVRFAMRTQPAFANLLTLKGNHEAIFLQAMAGDLDLLVRWLDFGGRDTLESFGVSTALIEGDDPQALLAAALATVPVPERFFLASLPLSLKVGDYLFCHAGVRPGVPLSEQSEEDLLWIRGDFLDSNEDLGAVVVHGHTVTPKVVERRNRIGIDTGAYRSDRLTAVGLDGDRRWFLHT